MAKPNLEALSLQDLEQLLADTQAAIKVRRAQETAALAERLRKEAEQAGLDPAAVARAVGGAGGKKRAPARPKYRHPADVSKTWTGKGKRPKWVTELLDSGKTLEDLLIQ